MGRAANNRLYVAKLAPLLESVFNVSFCLFSYLF